MKLMQVLSTLLLSSTAGAAPTAVNPKANVTYHGTTRNGIEVFLGIRYGQDIGGANRFKPPKLLIPRPGSTINATSYGLACPQQLGPTSPLPLAGTNVTKISEDYLNLDVARPAGTVAGKKLPVLVWIHGVKLPSSQRWSISH